MIIDFVLSNRYETLILGKNVARFVPNNFTIFLNGDLGAGKTTFVSGFLNFFNFKVNVKSPTYSFLEKYFCFNCCIFHIDFYRVNYFFNFENCIIDNFTDKNFIFLIEWPLKFDVKVVSPDLIINFFLFNFKRKVLIESCSIYGDKIIEKLI